MRDTQTRDAAKTYAAVHGTTGGRGGWIYSAIGKPICHGWDAYTDRLRRTGILVIRNDTVLIDWRRGDLTKVR